MLPLQLERRTILSIDVELEQFYSQILAEKKKLQPTNKETKEFLNDFPPKLLRKAAKVLRENPQVSRYQFLRNNCSLEISRDPRNPENIRVASTNQKQ